jgi:hypothetical protein
MEVPPQDFESDYFWSFGFPALCALGLLLALCRCCFDGRSED